MTINKNSLLPVIGHRVECIDKILLITLFYRLFIQLTFVAVWFPACGGIKREVRLHSGAIPVAVKASPLIGRTFVE